MFAKVKISGVLETVTGLHIGDRVLFLRLVQEILLSSGVQGRICR